MIPYPYPYPYPNEDREVTKAPRLSRDFARRRRPLRGSWPLGIELNRQTSTASLWRQASSLPAGLLPFLVVFRHFGRVFLTDVQSMG